VQRNGGFELDVSQCSRLAVIHRGKLFDGFQADQLAASRVT
jgi:hypothetical protein